ncbi:MAG TPA: hypothetical protein VKD72_12370 [Gemmataceae bacterium]|nr:hypothetical protein [Gemmataceae bacterium]
MSNFPSVDESFERLHRAAWSVGDVATAGELGVRPSPRRAVILFAP